ncbi:hypothetical protein VTN00DRAFT_6450 [Thermoascus crustaceus]|uniref:uncharacterized protein n=1 Tax=Thermoascus crustaceus TaxID=5088 RepID=UPI00374480D8
MLAKSILMAAAMLSASGVNAHMIMATPLPYGKSTLNNSPLSADGSDFPCKLREGVYDEGVTNDLYIGVPHPLSFVGSATHGGGSCQISLTTDKKPTKDSKWKVIHSIEGGCPANVDGNLSGGPNTPDPTTFKFTVPDSIAPGEYTLAWTWFNRVGNREMYMNCAPVAVHPNPNKRAPEEPVTAVSKRSLPDNLPDMFVANINGCMTKEGVDIRFPNPGDSVDLLGTITNLLGLGQPACEGGPGPGASAPSPADSATPSPAASTPEASSAPAPESEAPTQPTSAAPGIFVPTASPEPSPVAEASPAAPVVPSSSPEPSPSESGSSSGGMSGACSEEGAWNCVGGTSFQRCASGVWSEVMQLAAGTTCTAGQSDSLKIAAIDLSARSKIHLRRHVAGSNHA